MAVRNYNRHHKMPSAQCGWIAICDAQAYCFFDMSKKDAGDAFKNKFFEEYGYRCHSFTLLPLRDGDGTARAMRDMKREAGEMLTKRSQGPNEERRQNRHSERRRNEPSPAERRRDFHRRNR